MKKIVLLFAAAFMLCTNATFAQKTVNATEVTAKLDKCDADVQHAKKGLKASTWMTRGEAYVNALLEPTKALYVGMDFATMEVLCGKSKASGEKELGGKKFKQYDYPFFMVFVQDGKVKAWKTKKEIKPNIPATIIESYAKAFELDPSLKEKIKPTYEKLIELFKLRGSFAIEIGDMKAGADSYLKVAEFQSKPFYDKLDPTMFFYAGYMYTLHGEENYGSLVAGEKALNRAIQSGYVELEDADTEVKDSERGNIFYYLFHCAYGQKDKTPAKLSAATKYLQEGISKYPANEKIFEGLLQLYTGVDKVGDPAELLETIEKSIEKSPNSVNAWFGRGRIYFALKNYDECIISFTKVTDIDPKLFDGHFYLGLFHMLKGDEFLEKMNSKTYTDQASYDRDIAELNKLYIEAIPCFEAAHELKTDDKTTLEYLKQLCFRLRDEPGVMDKYTKYNELFKAL